MRYVGAVAAAVAVIVAAPVADGGRADAAACSRAMATVTLSVKKYPNIIAHIQRSWQLGYPRVLRIHRAGADARRDALLRGIPTRPGFDRDEAPAAVLRSTVRADVAYVPSSENRSAGATLGAAISRYCDGAPVRYRFGW